MIKMAKTLDFLPLEENLESNLLLTLIDDKSFQHGGTEELIKVIHFGN